MIHLAVNLAISEHQVEWSVPSVPTHWCLVPEDNMLSTLRTNVCICKGNMGIKEEWSKEEEEQEDPKRKSEVVNPVCGERF